MMRKETILFLCAHNDDHIIGGGGTIANCTKEGKAVHTLIFSYGESSHPHFKREVTVQMRVKESHDASKILGGSPVTYLAMKEGRFMEDFKKRRLSRRIVKYISDMKPTKIFTHSPDDPHPDHQAVYTIVTGLLDRMKYRGDVYCFDVWNPVSITTRNLPKLVVDISSTFSTKIKAMEAHKSQRLAKISLSWNLYAKAFINGLKYNVRYAEVFHKIR